MTITLTQPASILEKNISADKSTVVSGAKSIVNLFTFNFTEAGNEFLDVLSSLNLTDNDNELAWRLVFESIYKGIEKLLNENTQIELEDKPDNNETLIFRITEYLNQQEHCIDDDFFSKPNHALVIKSFKDEFNDWLKSVGFSKSNAHNFSNRYSEYVGLAFCEIWRTNKDYESLLPEGTPADENAKQIIKWQQYQQKLQQEVQKPVFDETISLKQLYIPLRASYARQDEDVEVDSHKGDIDIRLSNRNEKHAIVMLEDTISSWYDETDAKDCFRLLCGGPGSGKSSSAKMIAAKFSEQGKRVVFIPLHQLPFSRDLESEVDNFLDEHDRLGMPFFSNQTDEKTLLIFDGLDELAMQGKTAEENARSFIDQIIRKVDSLNTNRIRLKVLITGRDVVMQAQQNQFKKTNQILHLVPYFIEDDDSKYCDNDLKALNQRDEWWTKFTELKGLDRLSNTPEKYTQGKLGEITAQPLLNYLVALHHFSQSSKSLDENTNLNTIYNNLIKRVYERAWGDGTNTVHAVNKQLEDDEFERVLEVVAVAAWHGKGRTATESEITDKFKLFDEAYLLEKFDEYCQQTASSNLTNLLTSFYFKKTGSDNKGNNAFEFTHKSFEEYLVAKAMIGLLDELSQKLFSSNKRGKKLISDSDALLDWVRLTGASELTEYHFEFFVDEVILLKQTNPDELQRIQEALVKLVNSMLANDLPMDKTDVIGFQAKKNHAKQSKRALLACLGCVSYQTGTLAQLEFQSLTDFGTLLSEIMPQTEVPPFYSYLTNLDLRGQQLMISNLFAANLSGSYLVNVNLLSTNLFNANLSGTNLSGANLSYTDLMIANLEGANLEGADLKGADLKGANLKGADLKGANLKGANLEDANLEDANLEGANLEDANLANVDLDNVRNLKTAINFKQAKP